MASDANAPAAPYCCVFSETQLDAKTSDPLLLLFVNDPNALKAFSLMEPKLPINLPQADIASVMIAQEFNNQLPLPIKKQKSVEPASEPNKADSTSALAMHALIADFFSTYVSDSGLVDYKTLRRKRLDLIGALSEYSNVSVDVYDTWTKNDKLAYWINTFNLCMIRGVVDNYPIQSSRFKVIFYPANSIMQIDGFWDKLLFNIMGEDYTLNEMEQKILRVQFDEPRICLAITYASMGSPPLRREPYTGAKLDQQFDDQAKRFLASDGFRIDRDEPALYLSPVFDWYSAKFAAKYPAEKQFSDKPAGLASILTYISRHISRKDADWLGRKIFTVNWMRFNWTLNELR